MKNKLRILIPAIGLLVGAALGGIVGYIGQCSGST